jgi:hypothetical protein
LKGAAKMELKCKITADEVSKYMKKSTTKKFIKISLIGTAVFFPLLLYILYDFHFIEIWRLIFAVISISILYFGLLYFLLRAKQLYHMKKNIKKLGEAYFNSEKTIILDDEGLELRSILRTTKIPYSGIQLISDTDEIITIKFKAGDLIYIPIAAIQNPDIKDSFISLIKFKTVE